MLVEYNPGDEQLQMLEDELPPEMQSDEQLLNQMLEPTGTAAEEPEQVEEETQEQQSEVTEEEEDLIDMWVKSSSNTQEQKPVVDNMTLNVMKNVTESQLMRDILAYRQRGFTDAQIMAGISKLYLAHTQQQPQATAQTDDDEDTTQNQMPDIQALIQAEIEKRLNPIVNKVQQNEQYEQMKNIRTHNDNLFDEVIGNRQLNENEQGRIIEVFKRLYPTTDINRVRLTPEQVQAVVTLGLQGMKTTKTRQVQQQSPPVIAKGTATTQLRNGQAAPPKKVDGVSREERRLRLKDFMG